MNNLTHPPVSANIAGSMLEYALTSQEKRLVTLLRWWIFLFSVATVGFALFPDEIIRYLNTIGKIVFRSNAPFAQPSTETFWLILAISLMIVLIVAAIKAQLDIVKNISYVKIIIIAKLTSTLGYMISYFLNEFSFIYLAGAIIDGSILILTWFTYRRAIVSRYIK